MTPILPLLIFLAVQPPAPIAAPPTEPIPAATPAPIKSDIDPKAEALLAANEKAMLALKSYAAECRTIRTYPATAKRAEMKQYEISLLTAVKPNLMRYDGWLAKVDAAGKWAKSVPDPVYIFAFDGKAGVRQYGKMFRMDTRIQPENLSTLLEPWDGFYAKANSLRSALSFYRKQGKLSELKYAGRETVGGVPCDVISFRYAAAYEDETQSYQGKYYIGPDKLLRRKWENVRFGKDGTGFVTDATLVNIRTNFPPPAPSLYVYKPAKGVKTEAEAERSRPKLLAAGTPAPDFTVEDKDGKPVKLSDFRGKTVILDFWATWCGPCIASMSHTNKVGQKYKDKDVVVVAVNVWDEKDAYKDWVPKHPEYDAMIFLLDPHGRTGDVAKTLYNVSGIPTQYLIDKEGVIRASFLGFDDSEKDNPLELAVQAALK